MRNLVLILLFIPFLALSQSTRKRYELSQQESKLYWRGEDFGGAGSHEGTLQVISGYLLFENAQPIKGDFVIDMNSMRNTDQKSEKGQRDLEEHLKSDDFFSVAQFPKAFFSITKIVPAQTLKPDQMNITGFLGIKGITNLISFPAKLTTANQTVRAQADIIIDRTRWNVTYQSQTIFSTLKDGVISDKIKISVDLIFKAKPITD